MVLGMNMIKYRCILIFRVVVLIRLTAKIFTLSSKNMFVSMSFAKILLCTSGSKPCATEKITFPKNKYWNVILSMKFMKYGLNLCKNSMICCIKWNIIEVLFCIFSTSMSVYATIIAHKVDHFEELNVFHIFDKARDAINGLYKNMN